MEQIVSEIFRSVVNILFDQIKEQLGYVTSSRKHVTDMKNRMEKLNGRSVEVREHRHRNNLYEKEIPARVEGWLDEVEKLRNEVESIPKNSIGCLHMKTRYRAGKNAFKATVRIQELIEEKIEWTDAPLPTGRPTSSATSTPSSWPSGEDGFKSRDKPFNDALKFLQQNDKKSQVVALCGMGGVGKTTMMKQLKTVADYQKMFGLYVEVAIGRDPNMFSIQNQIAERIGGVGLHVTGETARGESLHKMFKKTLEEDKKKILLILDDVWQTINLEHFGLTSPLPDGVKVLLTSRDANICEKITADARSGLQVVRVNVLEEVEANKFFSQFTEISEEDDPNKYIIGCEIVKKCGFLPLAIRLIGSTLISQELHVWSDQLNRLKHNDLDKNVQEIIMISYEKLEDKHKEILLLCGLFPEDFDIPIEYLMRYAWGLKLLQHVSTLTDARDKTRASVSKLINASLLMNSDYLGCVKMHDLVLAFVLDRVSKSDHAWIINHSDVSKWDGDEMSDSCKIISLTCVGMSKFPTNFSYPDLSLLQLMHGDELLKFPDDFYESMRNLKVMAYYKMEYPLLPRYLKCSTNLRTLCLHECKLMFDLSFVGDLVNLEELSFAGCGIRKLPSTIGNLRKLKLLDLTGCVNLLIDDGVFGNLKNLEDLYMRVADQKGIRFTNANFKEFKRLLMQLCALEVEFVENNTQLKNVSFKKLDKFKISIGCQFEEEWGNEKYSSRNTLKLVTDSYKDLLDCKIDELFKKTEKLHLDVKDMIRLKDVVSIHPYDQRLFCYLRDLEVSNCVDLKYLFTIPVASGLRKLERLTISSCSVLEAVVHNDENEINSAGEMIIFQELKFLYLKELPKLVSLLPSDSVVELPQLVELELEGLPNFTSIYPDSSNISSLQRPLLSSQVRIPKLETLNIKSMEKLKQIWACSSEEVVNSISMLKKIKVEKCESLENMFPTNPMLLLSHLESIFVSFCDSIEEMFNIDLGSATSIVEQPSRGRLTSIQVFYSEKVREVWRIEGGENNSGDSSLLIQGFEAVKQISIGGCKMFRNVFTRTDIKFDMRASLNITIYNVGVVEKEITNSLWRDDNISTVAFTSNLMHSFCYLEDLVLESYNDVEVVFEIESPSSKELVTTTNNQQPLLLPNLQCLILHEMKSMSHVWKCTDWNKFLSLEKQSSFHNLTTIEMLDCHRIQYLFSSLMAKLLSNLKKIDIRGCDGMEEIVSNGDDKDEEMTAYTTATNFFPRLHTLKFYELRNLKRIGGVGDDKVSQDGIVSWSLCQYSKEIDIRVCGKLSSVIPSYAVGQMQKLEVLTLNDCDALMEVFETQGINNNQNGGGGGTSNTGPRLDNISVPQLSNLMKLEIATCNLLQHVFTFSTLESLGQLQELMIRECRTMKVIVKKENGDHRKVVKFPRLKSLELCSLPDLEGFFLGLNIEFEWPLLEKVTVSECPQIRVFTAGESRAKELKYIHTRLGKHTLECGLNFHVLPHQNLLPSSESTSLCLERFPWSFHNLIEIDMEYVWDYDIRNLIPFNELLQLQKLEGILVRGCNNVEEVFEVVAMEGTNNESQTVVEIPNLRRMELRFMERLKYVWKSNHHVVLKFPNLTTLSIHYCTTLKHVFTSSMVGSLTQLQELHIWSCEKMEVIIVKIEEEESKCVQQQMVVLPCLKVMKLEGLKSLKGFCLGKVDFSWPSLHTLEITDCPQITLFTNGQLDTPALDIIHTSFGRCYVGEDINSFIKTKQQEGFQF